MRCAELVAAGLSLQSSCTVDVVSLFEALLKTCLGSGGHIPDNTSKLWVLKKMAMPDFSPRSKNWVDVTRGYKAIYPRNLSGSANLENGTISSRSKMPPGIYASMEHDYYDRFLNVGSTRELGGEALLWSPRFKNGKMRTSWRPDRND